MKVLHVTDSYVLTDVPEEKTYHVVRGIKDYKRFWVVLQTYKPDIVHVYSREKETYGIYAFLAWCQRVSVVRTLCSPVIHSSWYSIKQLCARFWYKHTITRSTIDTHYIDKFHIARKLKRTRIYEGVDSKTVLEFPKKEAARTHIYKNLSISFTKNIKIIGTIISYDNEECGVEHLIDAMYLADKYKNLTNTLCVMLCEHNITKEIKEQIAELHVEGVCIVLENFKNPAEYIKAFDVFVSPRIVSGDLYQLLFSLYMSVPVIATQVGDTKEFESYAAAPLVPPRSAKFLTEAIMYVIKNPVLSKKNTIKEFVFPKKFTRECEKNMIQDVYNKIIEKRKKRMQ